MHHIYQLKSDDLTNGNLINADAVNAEFAQLVRTCNALIDWCAAQQKEIEMLRRKMNIRTPLGDLQKKNQASLGAFGEDDPHHS